VVSGEYTFAGFTGTKLIMVNVIIPVLPWYSFKHITTVPSWDNLKIEM
jgi:hypothetical protein